MNFSLEEKDEIAILKLKEERLDSYIASELKAQLLVQLESEVKNIVVDLSDTSYVDSSGLGALLLGVRQARENEGTFAICGAQKRVKSLINIAHLDDVLINYETVADALKEMK